MKQETKRNKPEQKQKNNAKSKPKSQIRIILLIAFLLIYIPSLIHWVYGRGVSKDLVRNGVIEDSSNFNGYIIRDEELLISPFEGIFIPEVDEGEKVPVNFRVATILKESSMELLDSKNEIDLKIIKQQSSMSEAQHLFDGDVQKIEGNIKNLVNNLISESNDNTFYNVKSHREDINELIKKKSTVLGGLDSKDVYINTLKNERERIKSQIQANTRDIYSQTSGIISYVIDGCEDALNIKQIDKISPSTLKNIPEIVQMSNEEKNAEPGKPFAKVIDNGACYVAIPMEASQATAFKAGNEIKLRLNDISRETYGRIVYVSAEDNEGLVAVEFDRYINELSDRREINVDLIKSSSEGLKVQVKSLQDIDVINKKARIVLVEGNYTVVEDVAIEALNKEYAVISSEEKRVNLYDTYVVNPGNMIEGQVVN